MLFLFKLYLLPSSESEGRDIEVAFLLFPNVWDNVNFFCF